MTKPTARQLLSAMSGNWDRSDPCSGVLRAAWELTRMDGGFVPGADVMRQQLVGRIADEVGGDVEFAAAVDHLAACVRAFQQTMTSAEPAIDARLDAISEARHDYELKYESRTRASDTGAGDNGDKALPTIEVAAAGRILLRRSEHGRGEVG